MLPVPSANGCGISGSAGASRMPEFAALAGAAMVIPWSRRIIGPTVV